MREQQNVLQIRICFAARAFIRDIWAMSHSLDSHHCAFESLRLIKKGERVKRGCPSFQLKYLWFVKLIFTLAIRNSSLSSCFSENFSLASAWN